MHELKAKDIEEYRKKIVERDKNKEDEVKEDKIKEDEDKGIREHRKEGDNDSSLESEVLSQDQTPDAIREKGEERNLRGT